MARSQDTLKMLPLSPAVFHILLALAGGECHGYGIMKQVESDTDGRTKMGPGTLYGSIKRLLKAGLVQETDDRPDAAMDNQRRRYYRLTGQGREVLLAELDRLQVLMRVASERDLVGGIRPSGMPRPAPGEVMS